MKAKADRGSGYGGTALMSAAMYNAVDAAMYNAVDAAMGNAVDMAKLLIASGANINAKDDKGKTALTYAVERSSEDVADILLNTVGAR